MPARWSIAIFLPIWSLLAPAFWHLDAVVYLLPLTLRVLISTRSLRKRSVADEQTLFKDAECLGHGHIRASSHKEIRTLTMLSITWRRRGWAHTTRKRRMVGKAEGLTSLVGFLHISDCKSAVFSLESEPLGSFIKVDSSNSPAG